MSTTITQLKRWFQAGVDKKATHMIIICDTFDFEDYPVYVMPGESAREIAKTYSGNMQSIMEVYDLTAAMEFQMSSNKRVFNWGSEEEQRIA